MNDDNVSISKKQFDKTWICYRKYRRIFLAVLAHIYRCNTRYYCYNKHFQALADEGMQICEKASQCEYYEDKVGSPFAKKNDPQYSPEICALGILFEPIAIKLSRSHHIKDCLKNMDEDDILCENDICDILFTAISKPCCCRRERNPEQSEKKKKKEEKQNLILKNKVGEIIQRHIDEDRKCTKNPDELLRSVLVEVLSVGKRVGWVRASYAQYRKMRLARDFSMYFCKPDKEKYGDLPVSHDCFALLSLNKNQVEFQELADRISKTPQYAEFYKKHKNSLKYRRKFFGILKKRVWPGQTDKEIIAGYLSQDESDKKTVKSTKNR